MEFQSFTTTPAAAQIRQVLSAMLGCQPRVTDSGLAWLTPKDQPGIRSAVLRAGKDGLYDIDITLAIVRETAGCSLNFVWESLAKLIDDTEMGALPIQPVVDDKGTLGVGVRVRLRDTAMDLPRLQRLEKVIAALSQFAGALQAELPSSTQTVSAQLPELFRRMVSACSPRMTRDSKRGEAAARLLTHLDSGLTVALVGSPPRIRLELDRLARLRSNLVFLHEPISIQKLPRLARDVRQAGFVLAAHCMLLRPGGSVYDQGRELDASLLQLEAAATPLLVYGSQAEQEATFGVGQGRDHSPMRPLIEYLPPATDADLVRAVLADRPEHLTVDKVEQIVALVLETAEAHAHGKEELLQTLANLAVELGPSNPELPQALSGLARDLVGRLDTFGTCDEAPARPRPKCVQDELIEKLRDTHLEDVLRARILGQEEAVREVARRIWQEVICRPATEPLRILLAGPVGTGKSMAAKLVAEILGWPYHYVDAASFDSSHAVMTSLAGASPGIVNSYNDGVLARIARRPSVVEVADLDHAQPGVRGTLCDFFLRILQEGTLQTGAGMVIRTIPSLIFFFTSNVAYGTRKATSRFGFGELSREEVCEEVTSQALEHLGHAFVSRVGQPVLFENFTRAMAIKVARAEIARLVGRVTGSARVSQSDDVAEMIIRSLPTTESGARGIVEAVRAGLAEALRVYTHVGGHPVVVRQSGPHLVVETDTDALGGCVTPAGEAHNEQGPREST